MPRHLGSAWGCLLAIGVACALGPARAAGDEPCASPLARVGEYVVRYQEAASSLVCEERYVQAVSRQSVRVDARTSAAPPLAPDVTREKRVLVSDYLLVRLPGTAGWAPFRDVYSVDGRAVRDRVDRLTRLFVSSAPGDARQQAERIRWESSRYNIGSAIRDINVPTYALALFHPSLHWRFSCRLGGRENVAGVDAQMLEYEETGRPTLVRGEDDKDSPVKGRLWIDPRDGTVLRTRLETGPRGLHTRIDVVFRRDEGLGLWVPAEMKESHEMPGEEIDATATYGRFRRFQVETSESIAPPK